MTSEEIQQIFFAECDESLAAAESGLAACKAGVHDSDTINAVFRAVHSIKGGAGAFGFAGLQAYTHTFETLLSDVRDGSVALAEPLVDLLLRALDVLSDHVVAARDGGALPDDAGLIAEMTAAQANGGGMSESAAPAPEPEPEPEPEPVSPPVAAEEETSASFDDMLDDIMGFMGGDAAASSVDAPSVWQLHLRPRAGAMCNGGEPLLLLRELMRLGGVCVECDLAALPNIDQFDATQAYFGWTFDMPVTVEESMVREIFDFVSDDYLLSTGPDAAMPPADLPLPVAPVLVPVVPTVSEPVAAAQPAAPVSQPTEPVTPASPPAPAAAAPAQGATAGQSIRIDLAKLDRLIDAVGELVIAQAMMAQRLDGSGVGADEELTLLETLTRDIQESAMSIRAQPIGTVFNRVPRILRELAVSTGKHVRLELSGEATELDKTVIERLGEPLTHLIRNSVDHGIESVEDRLAAGKEPEGTLTLSAEHRSGRIFIRIRDDGRGIDRVKVFSKAVEKGLIAPDAQLLPEEIDNLIFAPGFSTAATVTSVSGRGVGMDVVRQNVKDLGGRITIESEQGVGTTMTLTLPLTLAIADGMIVEAGGNTLVVPLAHVVECLRPEPGQVQGLGGRAVINMRGRFIPVVSLRDAIHAHGHQHGHAHGAVDDTNEGVLIVVDTETAGQSALLVDQISDQRQFVIKSLDTNFRPVEGVAGATILGDGRVALILDVDGMVSDAVGSPRPGSDPQPESKPAPEPAEGGASERLAA